MPVKLTTSNSNDPNSLHGYLAILGDFKLHTLFALDQPVFSVVTQFTNEQMVNILAQSPSLSASIQSHSQSCKSASQSGKINKEKEEKETKAEKGKKQGRGKEKKERKGLKKAKTLCKACVKDQVACIFWRDAQPHNGKVACVNCSHRKC
ncbi:hypothetical protein DL96DRAFT_1724719 [Flagelloscypha sp. PMI_526]|nr:hypothetical protein DL96DRAFT_1724719 [Flagelloscypha sp. PMI_526]